MISRIFSALKRPQVMHPIKNETAIICQPLNNTSSATPKKIQKKERSIQSADPKVKKPRTKKIKEIPISPFDESLKILSYLGASTVLFVVAYYKDEQAKQYLQNKNERNDEAEVKNESVSEVTEKEDDDIHAQTEPKRITIPIYTKLP